MENGFPVKWFYKIEDDKIIKHTSAGHQWMFGARFAKRAALLWCSSMLSFPHRCLTATSSSYPVWRASAAPSLSSSLTEASCNPPPSTFSSSGNSDTLVAWFYFIFHVVITSFRGNKFCFSQNVSVLNLSWEVTVSRVKIKKGNSLVVSDHDIK